MRIGFGWDSHEYRSGVPLTIGGVTLPHAQGLAGHSDGDVLLHALTDALLGAVAAGDIGGFFPPSYPKRKGAEPALFFEGTLQQGANGGYYFAHNDSNSHLSPPKLGPQHQAQQQHLERVGGNSPPT